MIVSYAVQSGGFLDIDVKIYDTDMKIVFQSERETEGDLQYVAAVTGVYRLCFGNTMSTVTGKVVSFNMYVGNSMSKHDAATSAHLDPLEKSINMMAEGLNSLEDHQRYIATRTQRCRSTQDSTASRVLWCQFLETAGIIGISCLQVFFLRRMFEKTKSV